MADLFEMTGRDDRRREERKKKRICAWADPGGTAPVVDCMIVDLSPEGACVASVDGAPLPDNFTLQLDLTKEVGAASVMWRADSGVGVKFGKPEPRSDG